MALPMLRPIPRQLDHALEPALPYKVSYRPLMLVDRARGAPESVDAIAFRALTLQHVSHLPQLGGDPGIPCERHGLNPPC